MAVITVLVSGIMATPDRQRPRGASRRHPPRPGVHHTLPATGIHPNPGLTAPERVTAHQLEEAPRTFGGSSWW